MTSGFSWSLVLLTGNVDTPPFLEVGEGSEHRVQSLCSVNVENESQSGLSSELESLCSWSCERKRRGVDVFGEKAEEREVRFD